MRRASSQFSRETAAENYELLAHLSGRPKPPKRWRTKKGMRRFLRSQPVQRWFRKNAVALMAALCGNYIQYKLRQNQFITKILNRTETPND